MKYKGIIYISILALLVSCKPNLTDEFEPSQGTADFTRYLSFGNSLTAGFADGALSLTGQQNSYPCIIAHQLKSVGFQGEFKQPLMPTANGVGVSAVGLQFIFNTKYILGYRTDCMGVTSLGPVLADPNASQQELAADLTTPVTADGPFNNIGVPGLKSWEAVSQFLGFNPFWARFKSADAMILTDEIAKINPTFFTLWLGSNDVLMYAISGGTSPLDPITDHQLFSNSMDAVMAALTANGAKGAVANIPDIKSIPYFTTVPYNALVLTEELATQLNEGYALYNGLMEQLGLEYRINFQAGANALVVMDTSMPVPAPYEGMRFRQIKPNELVLLSIPQDSLKCAGWGSQVPVPKAYTLFESQITAIDLATVEFNNKIEGYANLDNIALVDMNSHLEDFITGMVFDGETFSTRFILGGAFSTDGIHMNPRGYAIAANYFIEAINAKFNANIPKAILTDYDGLVFP